MHVFTSLMSSLSNRRDPRGARSTERPQMRASATLSRHELSRIVAEMIG